MGVSARDVVWEFHVKQFGDRGAAIWRGVGERGTDGQNLETTRPLERRLEKLGIRGGFGSVASCSDCVGSEVFERVWQR